MEYKIPLLLTPQVEGGCTVTSPLLPELVTEGDSLDEALENVKDVFAAVLELYQEMGRSLSKINGTWLSRTQAKRWGIVTVEEEK